MNIGEKIKGSVELVKARVRSYKAERDVKMQYKERDVALKSKLEYADAKDYLDRRKTQQTQQKTIELARAEKKKDTLPYKFVQGLKGFQGTPSKPKRKLANVGRNAFLSSGNVRTGSFDNSVLFGNMRKK